MMRNVVLDTNCLVQALPQRSPYHLIWKEFLTGSYRLCVSNEILDEYEEIIGRLATPDIAKNIVEAIVHSPYTIYKESHFKFHLIEADPDDNKFVDCAIATNAEYLVSEDAHFRCLAAIPFPTVRVIELDYFLRELNKE